MSTFIVHWGCTVHTMEGCFLFNANHSGENGWTDKRMRKKGTVSVKNAHHLVKLTSITLLPYTTLPLSGAVGRHPPSSPPASQSILPSIHVLFLKQYRLFALLWFDGLRFDRTRPDGFGCC